MKKLSFLFLFIISCFISFSLASTTIFAESLDKGIIGVDVPIAPQIKSEDTYLINILNDQELGLAWPFNPIKYAIRGSIQAGVPATTIVMLLLLPLIAAFIPSARHIIGLRGFGIFFPAALSVVFLSLGPVLGILLFVTIVFVSVGARSILHSLKLKMQY